jgi:hypothetical protein
MTFILDGMEEEINSSQEILIIHQIDNNKMKNMDNFPWILTLAFIVFLFFLMFLLLAPIFFDLHIL